MDYNFRFTNIFKPEKKIRLLPYIGHMLLLTLNEKMCNLFENETYRILFFDRMHFSLTKTILISDSFH